MTTETQNYAKDTTVKWGRSLGNGATALAVAVQAVDHVRQHRDTTVLAKMVDRARSAGDANAASQLGFIIRQVFENAKMSKDKNNNAVVKIKGCDISNSAINTLEALVEDGRSIRSPEVRKAFKSEDEKADDSWDIQAWADRVVKAHPKQVQAAKAALDAALKRSKASKK